MKEVGNFTELENKLALLATLKFIIQFQG